MLIDTKRWSDWSGDALYETVNCTSRYAHTRTLTVLVTEDGHAVSGACVRFQIVNYSELFTLWEAVTDEQGFAHFETGLGDLFVYARHNGKVALQKVDLRLQNSVTLALNACFPEYLEADLVPPEDSSGAVPCEDSPHHKTLLARCEAHLAARRAEFSHKEGYLRLAALNGPEILAFLEDSPFPRSRKEALLDTLRPKDFVDISRETLEDILSTATMAELPYSEEIFRAYILAPRVADEMLLPQRQKIRSLFPQGFENPREIAAWMQYHMQILPEEGVSNYYPSAFGCLRCRQVPAFAFDMVFVSLCRAFCFPARLDPHTGEAQWLDGQNIWHNIRPTAKTLNLTLEFPAGKPLHYAEHFSLGYWDGHDFVTLRYPDLTVESSHSFSLRSGFYRIAVTTRQIDGTASIALWHLTLTDHTFLRITPPQDQTIQRLKQIPLHLPEGPLQTLLQQKPDRNLLLMFTDPGSEPTEHLLTELLELAKDFRKLSCRILLITDTPDGLNHPTVEQLKAQLPELELLCLRDPEALAALHRQMQAGDLRLPFVICADRQGNGIYADANYRIRMAQTLLEIQKYLCEHRPSLR